jgi:hypothetical protein
MPDNYLSDDGAPQATVVGPFELCDSILLVRADGLPQRRHTLPMRICVRLGSTKREMGSLEHAIIGYARTTTAHTEKR